MTRASRQATKMRENVAADDKEGAYTRSDTGNNKKPPLNQRRVYLEVVCRVRTILHAYVVLTW